MWLSRRVQGRRWFGSWAAAAMVAVFVIPVAGAAPAVAAPGDISTLAGGKVGDGGPATQALLSAPDGVAVDGSGNIFVLDGGNSRVRRIDTHGIITTFAGTGIAGFSGDGGPAVKAKLNVQFSAGIAVDAAGQVFFGAGDRVRKVDTHGIITTVAGGGHPADQVGDNGPALSAAFFGINGLAVNGSGELFISDPLNTVRKVDASGIITRVAGNGTQGFAGDGGPATAAQLNSPQGLAVDAAGDLLIAEQQNSRVRKVVPGSDGKINGDSNDIITTVAGSDPGFSFGGDGGPAASAQLSGPTGVAVDRAGDMFITDFNNGRVRKVDSHGIITTFAGNGGNGYSGDGGPAVAAQFNSPNAVAVDPAGNVVIADAYPGAPRQGNNVIRRVNAATGIIATIAGGGEGDGRPAGDAFLSSPWGLAIAGGSTYITENGSNRVRRVGPGGRISTVAGGGSIPMGDGGAGAAAVLNRPQGVALNAQGDLFIADSGNNVVREVAAATGVITTVAGGGTPADSLGDNGAALAAALSDPEKVAVDAAGNLFVSDEGHNRVRKVDHVTGIITTVAGNGTGANGTAVDGIPAVQAPLTVRGIAVDSHGSLFIADVSDQRIRKVDGAGIITTVAGNGTFASTGDGGPAAAAAVALPEGVAIDGAGNMFISGIGIDRVRKVVPGADGVFNGAADEIITAVAGGGSPPDGLGDGGPATAAQLNTPLAATDDPSGRVVIADSNNSRIRAVDTAGKISTLAGNGAFGFGGDGGPAAASIISGPTDLNVDAAGNVFFVDSGNNRIREIDTNGVITTVAGGGVGDGLAATSIALTGPRGVAVDPTGNVFIAECGSSRVRRVDAATGTISTFAGGGTPRDGVGDGGAANRANLSCPTGLLLVSSGISPVTETLYIADCGVDGSGKPAGDRVRKVDLSGTITTVAGTGRAGFTGTGGPAVAAQLSCPSDIRLDPAGRLLIADRDNNRVRRVNRAGLITTVAGDGANGFATGGAATKAHVNNPTGLAVDAAGDVFIAENSHARVTKVTPAGNIATVAGQGLAGFAGDGGPATVALLSFPTQVALDPAGNLLITDGTSLNPTFPAQGNQRVRKVAAGSPPPPPAGCGEVVTANTTLTADLGPCSGDGIVVGADGVTLNLGGHKVFGAEPGDGSHAGIRLTSRKAVTVTNGTVSGFAAGVAVLGGSGNTVSHLSVVDNAGPQPPAQPEFGDGIAVLFSSHNKILDNLVLRNGPYDGIAIEGLNSSFNTIQRNTVDNTNSGPGIIANPFLDSNLPGRGGSIQANNVIANTVEGNGGAGISNLSNQNALISGNLVQNNGFNDPNNGLDNGIGIQALQTADPNTADTVDGNTVHGNARDGIEILNGHMNHITNNNAANNAVSPMRRPHDLADFTFDPTTFARNCTDNVWFNNIWGSGGFNPPCTTAGGSGPNPPTGAASTAAPDSNTAAPDLTQLPAQRHLTPADEATARAILNAK